MNSVTHRSLSFSPKKQAHSATSIILPIQHSMSNISPRRSKYISLLFKASDDENDNRTAKVKHHITRFQALITDLKQNDSFGLKEVAREAVEEVYKKTLENIFTLYNVNANVILQDQSDSALRIEPVIHPGKAVYVLICIAHILVKFPYSFIRLLDLNKFSVCKNYHLKKEQYGSFYTSRIMSNAIFSLQEHKTYEKIEKHFYKIVLYHMQKKMPSIDSDWPHERAIKLEPIGTLANGFSPSPSQQNLHRASIFSNAGGFSSSPTQQNLHRASIFAGNVDDASRSLSPKKSKKYNPEETRPREQFDTFCRIMKSPREAFESPSMKVQYRAKFLKDQWECIDPVGINTDFWKSIAPTNSDLLDDLAGYLIL